MSNNNWYQDFDTNSNPYYYDERMFMGTSALGYLFWYQNFDSNSDPYYYYKMIWIYPYYYYRIIWR